MKHTALFITFLFLLPLIVSCSDDAKQKENGSFLTKESQVFTQLSDIQFTADVDLCDIFKALESLNKAGSLKWKLDQNRTFLIDHCSSHLGEPMLIHITPNVITLNKSEQISKQDLLDRVESLNRTGDTHIVLLAIGNGIKGKNGLQLMRQLYDAGLRCIYPVAVASEVKHDNTKQPPSSPKPSSFK